MIFLASEVRKILDVALLLSCHRLRVKDESQLKIRRSKMKVGIISGSHREQSQSGKVARFIEKRVEFLLSGTKTYSLDLGVTPLPLWDESKWSKEGNVKKVFNPVSTALKECEGFVVVTPEWSGMVPAALKNFFLLCDSGELAHKPALIIAVSASTGGAYPIAELRMSSYKNTFLNYIPDQIIVRSVENVLNSGTPNPENKADVYIQERIDYSLKVLYQYTLALRGVRSSGVIDPVKYPYGM
jgi:NAD(P)H-dependent FMN reductase